MTHVPYGEISSILLHVLGSEDNKRDSFVNVKYPDSYRANMPYPGGIYDLHMGTTDPELECSTCQHKKKLCLGHPGVVDLKYPVQNPLYLKEIQKWLKIICFNCGKPVLEDSVLEEIASKRIRKDKILREYVVKVGTNIKNRVCAHCENIHPHVTKIKTDNISIFIELYDQSGGKSRMLTHTQLYPHKIREILQKVSRETCLKLGKPLICHPSKFILDNLRAPPNTIRPDIKKLGGGRSNNNDVTVLLQNIVKVNEKFPDQIPEEISDDLDKDIKLLEMHVYEMIKGSSGTSKQSLTNNSKKPLTSIAKRLPRKHGRIRRNLMGRRANHMARSFITCDPSLRIDEIGLPMSIARNLQMPVHVRDYNYKQCEIYFMNGVDRYPGCTQIEKKTTGSFHHVDKVSKDFKLEIGDIIYRDLIDGDIVDFNRQPSLEPSSISAMSIRVLPEGETIRMNVLACPLFNADFDGDAMNVLIPRSSRTVNEIKQLSSPKERFIAYKNGAPVIGEAQDSLIGTAELTRSETRMDKLHAMRLFGQLDVYQDFSTYNKDSTITGRNTISFLLKNTNRLVNFTRRAKYYDAGQKEYREYKEDDINVEIDRGELNTGILDKASVGEGSSGGIFHIIHNQYGPDAALESSYQIQQMALAYLFNRGVTVSIRDLIMKPESRKEIHDIESTLIAESRQITDNLNKGKIIAPLGKTIEEHYEELQMAALDPGDQFWPPILKSIDPEVNNFDKLIMYGSKGKLSNFKNVSTAVGQIEINGERMPNLFGRRTLAYFTRYDSDPEARGYIPDSYISGMGVAAFIFHAMENRYQLINKGLSTSITGMYNRMAVKNLEPIIVDNNRRVNKSGRMIQLIYGSDGVDPRYLEKVFFPTMKASLTTKELEAQFKHRDTAHKTACEAEFKQLLVDREMYTNMFINNERSGGAGVIYKDNAFMPVNVKRIIEDTIYNLRLKKTKSSLNPTTTIKKVQDLCDSIIYCLLNDTQEIQKSLPPMYMQNATLLLKILIRSHLNVENLIRHKVNDNALDIIIRDIKMTYKKSLISYGTAVGIIAAQSISEPMTQMVLDSHHHSGTASTKKKGMGRIREILNVRATDGMKSPTMLLDVVPEFRHNKEKVQEIANHIEMLSVRQFIRNWKIFYEPYGKPEHPDYKDESKLIREFEKYNPNIKQPSNLINWCIRLSISKTMMIEKQMKMSNIYTAIRKKFPFTHIVYSVDNAETMIVRIYLKQANSISKSSFITVSAMRYLVDSPKGILDTVVRGVNGIKATYLKESNMSTKQSDGSVKVEKGYKIFCDGTNMNGVLMNPCIDHTTVQTDSIVEMKQHFGIEAGRLKAMQELREQIGDAASYRHFTIPVDEMSYTGEMTSIDRYGSAKRNSSFMLRISDASPLSVIEESAINASMDRLNGVSPPIMVGRNPHVGDLYNTFKLDEEFISERIKNLDTLLDEL